MKKVLITGGLGFVGGRLAERLIREYAVLISSRNPPTAEVKKTYEGMEFVLSADLLTPGRFPKDIHAIIHLAALNEHDCVRFPSEAIRVNIDETRILLQHAIENGVNEVYYFSTAHVYASPLFGRFEESMACHPRHPYAITHKAAEDYVLAAAKPGKMQTVVLRLSNSFGYPLLPTVNRWTLLANDLCRQAIEKKSMHLLSNGCQYRDFICLSDVSEAMASLLAKGVSNLLYSTYNLSAGNAITVGSMATQIQLVYKQLYGETPAISFPENVSFSNEPTLLIENTRLTAENVNIRNDIASELEALLIFCKQNFSR